MRTRRSRAGVAVAVSCGALLSSHGSVPASGQPAAGATPVSARLALAQALPALDGKRIKVSAVEVTYAPGASSAAHSHPCPLVGYVIEGSMRMQVQGGPETVYRPGDSFYEAPNGVHLVSANASDTAPARFVVFFACDREGPLSVAVPERPTAR